MRGMFLAAALLTIGNPAAWALSKCEGQQDLEYNACLDLTTQNGNSVYGPAYKQCIADSNRRYAQCMRKSRRR
jgi:hypothetical protein